MRFPLLPLLGASLAFTSLAACARAAMTVQSVGRDSTALYRELCSSCHGPDLEGAKGPPLARTGRKHGDDDESLTRSILEGYPQSEMPGFAAALSPAETQALIAFIREKTVRAADPQPNRSEELPTGTQSSEVHGFRMESVAEGLDVPWSLTFLPDGSFLVTERSGRLRLVANGRLQSAPITGVPKVVVRDEAGLMSVVAHPDFAQNHWIYLTYSDPGEGETAMTKIIRARLRDGALVDQQTIFAIPTADYQDGYVLFGGRLVFVGDYLFFGVGERGPTGDAQRLEVPNGKIHRVFHDGRIPPDNPFVATPGAVPSIWAYGIRNPQGLAYEPATATLWETEHGPRGGDELNFIERGKNYGWPVITQGMNYDGTPITDKTEAPGMEQPAMFWTPSIATSEIEFYSGNRFPGWKGQLFLGSLAQQKLLRLTVDSNHRVTHVEELFKHLGRIRDVKTGPDGAIYLALERVGQRGRVVRLVPADQ